MLPGTKIPLGEGGECTEGIERKVFLKEAGSFFIYYNSVINLYLLLFL